MSPNLPISVSLINRPPIPFREFIGREVETNSLVEALSLKKSGSAFGPVAMIYGVPGIGKTELAQVVAQRLSQKFPDGQLAIQFSQAHENLLAAQQVLETIIHILDPLARLPDDVNELRALYVSLLEETRILIIVDQVADEETVNLLVPPPTCALLLTTRRQFNFPTAFTLHLDKLLAADSERLLLAICPRLGSGATRVAQLCRYIPLALRLSATLLVYEHSFEEQDYIDGLAESVEQTANDNDHPAAFIDLFIHQTYQRLDPTSRQIFCQLGPFSDGFDQTAATAAVTKLTNLDLKALKQIKSRLETLCQVNLLVFDESTKLYRMYPSVRHFALDHLADPAEIYFRLAHYYANLIEDCAALARRGSDGILFSLLIFDDHKFQIKQLWEWLQQASKSSAIDTLMLRFYQALASFGRLRFIPNLELIPQLKSALEAAQRLNDLEAASSILGNLGRTHYLLGQGQKALDYYEQQLGLIRMRGNRSEEANLLRDIRLAQALLEE
jgi:hypothetical protein